MSLSKQLRDALTVRSIDQATIERMRVQAGCAPNTQVDEMNDAQLRTMLVLVKDIPLWKKGKTA